MAHHSYTDARTKPNHMLKINKAVKPAVFKINNIISV